VLFDFIDWEARGDFVWMLSPIQWINVTKWMIGWLPVAKNMWGLLGYCIMSLLYDTSTNYPALIQLYRGGYASTSERLPGAVWMHVISNWNSNPNSFSLVVKSHDPSSNIYTSLNIEIFQAFQAQQLIGESLWIVPGIQNCEHHSISHKWPTMPYSDLLHRISRSPG